MPANSSPSAYRLLILSMVIIATGCALSAGAARIAGQGAVEGNRGRKGGKGRTKIGKRGGGGGRTRIPLPVTVNPNPMPCSPRNATVPLPPAPPGKLYLPNCAVVERCSGCCSSESTECVPKPQAKMAKVTWKSNEYALQANGQWTFNKVVSFEIEKHTKCTCGCKIRAEHCSARQSYDRASCRCNCNNYMESVTCTSPKYWDIASCSCRCPLSSMDCTTGTFFDPDSCECVSAGRIYDMVSAGTENMQPDIYTL